MTQLNGRVAIVTGSSRGIGRAIALSLAEKGASVVINYLVHEDLACAVVEDIRYKGETAIMIQADVRCFSDVQEMVQATIKRFGVIDILVNNAGVMRDRTLVNMTQDEWHDVIDTNLNGVFNCTKAVINSMIKQGYGKIVNISSFVSQIGNFGQCNYVASKAAIEGFTKSVAKEVAKKGITINAIVVGLVDTDMTKKIPERYKQRILNQIPLNRFTKSEEVAEFVAFLVSDSGRHLTGQVLSINGGLS